MPSMRAAIEGDYRRQHAQRSDLPTGGARGPMCQATIEILQAAGQAGLPADAFKSRTIRRARRLSTSFSMAALLGSHGMPATIADLDLHAGDYAQARDELAMAAFRDPSLRPNPRMPLVAELHDLLHAAHEVGRAGGTVPVGLVERHQGDSRIKSTRHEMILDHRGRGVVMTRQPHRRRLRSTRSSARCGRVLAPGSIELMQ